MNNLVQKLTADWVTNTATQTVCTTLTNAGYQVYFVGGCVRNALLNAPVNDIDLSTDAHPETVMRLCRDAGLKVVPTGIEHGTVTVIADGAPHEITTFRRDIETDGRRAVVAFSDNMTDDALRRDFTMNALYADPDGVIIDPLGGISDLKARRIRFIENADQRIREDYLRILRFFRFHAWYGDPAGGLDADGLAAIATNLAGLETLSRERVGSEIKKLLSAPDPAPSVAAMRATGVLANILPASNDRALAPLIHLENQIAVGPDAMRRLAALGAQQSVKTLRLSRAEMTRFAGLYGGIESISQPHELGFRHGFDMARDIIVLRAALFETPLNDTDLKAAKQGAVAVFPIKPADLMPAYTGVALGEKLRVLEAKWIKSTFKLTRESLLAS